MKKVKIISGDIDGLALRRQKAANKSFLTCDGKNDDDQINEAMEAGKARQFSIWSDAWERIFGKR